MTINDIWEGKYGKLLYKTYRGSQTYGTAVETSDWDTISVYLAPTNSVVGLGYDYVSQVEDKSHDNVAFEFGRWLELLIKGNPNILESLFVDDEFVLYEDPIITKIKADKEKFLTKKCFGSFGGYAVSQIKKARGLNKKIVNPVTEMKEPLDFVYTFYRQGSTNIQNWLAYRGLRQEFCGLVAIPNMHNSYGVYYDFGSYFKLLSEEYKEEITPIGCHEYYLNKYQNDDTNDIKYRDDELYCFGRYLKDFLVSDDTEKRYHMDSCLNEVKNFKGMVNSDKSSLDLKLSSVPNKDDKPICSIVFNQEGYSKHCNDYHSYKKWEKERNPHRYESNLEKNYDSKNMMHCFRLINMCIEIAKGEGMQVMRKQDRAFLLSIRKHEYEYDYLIELLEQKKKIMDEACLNSTIADEYDVEYINNLLIDVRLPKKMPFLTKIKNYCLSFTKKMCNFAS